MEENLFENDSQKPSKELNINTNDIQIRSQKIYTIKLSFFAKTFKLSMSYN